MRAANKSYTLFLLKLSWDSRKTRNTAPVHTKYSAEIQKCKLWCCTDTWGQQVTSKRTHTRSPTFWKILELVAGLLLPPLPGFEQFSYWWQLASLLSWCRGILGIGGAVHHHVTAGQWWWFLQPINYTQKYKKIISDHITIQTQNMDSHYSSVYAPDEG